MGCHTLSIILFSIGLRAVFKNRHYKKDYIDLYSIHRLKIIFSWVGLGSVILYSILYIVGFVSFILKVLKEE